MTYGILAACGFLEIRPAGPTAWEGHMVWWWVAAAWLALALGVVLLVVRSIRLANSHAAQEAEPNFVVDVDSPPPGWARDSRVSPQWASDTSPPSTHDR